MSSRSLVDFAAAAFRDHPGPALVRDDPGRRDVSAADLDRGSLELAAALVTYGLEPGSRVAVLTDVGEELLLGFLAVIRAGATLVPLEPGDAGNGLLDVLRDTSARQILVSDETLLDRILSIRPDLPALDLVLLFREAGEDRAAALTVAGARAVGANALERSPDLLTRPAEEGAGAPAMLLHGGLAGIPLTHANVLAAADSVAAALRIERGATVLSSISAQSATHLALSLACLARGAKLAHVSRADGMGAALAGVRPQLAVLPRSLAGALRTHLELATGATSWLGKRLLRFALRQGERRSEAELLAGRLPSATTWGWRVADLLVIRRIREALGGRLTGLVSLGEPLPVAECLFLLHLGVPFLEGLAFPEAGGLVAVGQPDGLRAGTVGRLVSGLEARSGEDGALELRGPTVPGGGWRRVPFRGRFDGDGYLSGSFMI